MKTIHKFARFFFLTEDEGGNMNLSFAYFNASTNDLNKEWFHNVKLLKENGKLTADGEVFLNSNRHIAKSGIDIIGSSSYEATLYENDNGDGVVTTLLPMDLKDKIPEEKWTKLKVKRDLVFDKRTEYGKKYKLSLKQESIKQKQPPRLALRAFGVEALLRA
jgi:hypothetical protein